MADKSFNAFKMAQQQFDAIAKQLGLDSNAIIEEMMSGDYENLLEVFDNAFGDLVILER